MTEPINAAYAYDLIDRFLRNNLGDDDYQEYSEALESLVQPAEVGEPVYAFRRKGLDDFCTCTAERHAELSTNHRLFETRVFYTTPQPTQSQAVPLTHDQTRAMRKKHSAEDTCVWSYGLGIQDAERHHGITAPGGQNEH